MFALVAMASPLCSHAQQQPTFTEWHDCAVNEVNRFPLHTNFFAFESNDKAMKGDKNQTTTSRSKVTGNSIGFLMPMNAQPTSLRRRLTTLHGASWLYLVYGKSMVTEILYT